jgi:hypothetical protein
MKSVLVNIPFTSFTILFISFILTSYNVWDILSSMKTNKQTGELKVINDVKDEPSLEQAQAFVGGYVEGISFPNGDYLIVNEEGKLKGLPFNVPASKLWKDTFDNDNYMTGREDYVVGNAILIKKAALKEWAA